MPADAAARIRALAYRNHPEQGGSGDHAWDSGKAGVAARDLPLIRLRMEDGVAITKQSHKVIRTFSRSP